MAVHPEISMPAVTTGAPNGVSRNRAFDRWFRYPAGFSSDALLASMAIVGDGGDSWLIDPFAGTASAGTAAIENGWRYAGIEAHPAIAELGQLKFARPGKPAALRKAAAHTLEASGNGDIDGEEVMVRRCFDADILKRLVGLREAILNDNDNPWSTHLKWALMGCLRDVASVKVGWPYQRPGIPRSAPHKDVDRRFLQRVALIALDLEEADHPNRSRVVAGDSRIVEPWRSALGSRKASACITSPPYLNNFDYADATRLEMYFWGYAKTWSELCEGVRVNMLTATTQQTQRASSDAAMEKLSSGTVIGEKIRDHARALEAERIRRGRGKEYDRILGPYFLGIGQVLSHLFKNLERGSPSAWIVGDSAPYGIYLDTPSLISELAVEAGFTAKSDQLVRRRGTRWRTNGTRHQVELTERLITFSKPIDGRKGQAMRRLLLARS